MSGRSKGFPVTSLCFTELNKYDAAYNAYKIFKVKTAVVRPLIMQQISQLRSQG